MLPKITIDINPNELYDEMDLYVALRSLAVTLIAITNGLRQCTVKDEKGKATGDVLDVLYKLAAEIERIANRIVYHELTVTRE